MFFWPIYNLVEPLPFNTFPLKDMGFEKNGKPPQ